MHVLKHVLNLQRQFCWMTMTSIQRRCRSLTPCWVLKSGVKAPSRVHYLSPPPFIVHKTMPFDNFNSKQRDISSNTIYNPRNKVMIKRVSSSSYTVL